MQSVLQLADTTPTSEGVSPLRSVLSRLNAPFTTWISLLADRHSLLFQADLGAQISVKLVARHVMNKPRSRRPHARYSAITSF